MSPEEVPDVVVLRLPMYVRALSQLLDGGDNVVSSQQLGTLLQMTPAQIRKDLSYFGRFGKQGRGYDIRFLREELFQILGLDLDRETFTLCLVCNEPILQVQPEAVQDRIPPYVYETQRRFHECPKCSRVYWQGTHLNRMNSRLEKIKEHAKKARKEIP